MVKKVLFNEFLNCIIILKKYLKWFKTCLKNKIRKNLYQIDSVVLQFFNWIQVFDSTIHKHTLCLEFQLQKNVI